MASEFKGKKRSVKCVKLNVDGTLDDVDDYHGDSDWRGIHTYPNRVGIVKFDMPGFVQHNLHMIINKYALERPEYEHPDPHCDKVNDCANEVISLLDKSHANIDVTGPAFVFNCNNINQRIDFTVDELNMLMHIGYSVKQKNEMRAAQALLPF